MREFPAQFARASLKPKVCVHIGFLTRREFPAQFARASLKRGGAARPPLLVEQFPAQFARASLKPRVGGLALGALGNFPRNLRGPH